MKALPYNNLFTWLMLAALILPLAACEVAPAAPQADSNRTPQVVIVLAGADATLTPTPFQPIPVTPTYLPTDLPTPTLPPTATPEPPEEPQYDDGATRNWSDYPGPSVWPDVQIPSPVGILAQPEDQINILLLGSDQRPNDTGFRTDTILLVTLSPGLGTVTLTSFPRDLYVYIPGWTVQRINTAFAFGGFDALALTMEYNFGVRPVHYAMIKLDSFVDVINSMGGINVDVTTTLTDQRDGYGQYTIYSGMQLMDGGTALWYTRSRYSTSDFDRGRRQQEVLEGVFRKLVSLDGISRAPQLYDIYRQSVMTDMEFDDMAPFLPLAAKMREDPQIRRFTISPREVIPIVNSYGAQVLLPVREAVLAIMRQALNTP